MVTSPLGPVVLRVQGGQVLLLEALGRVQVQVASRWRGRGAKSMQAKVPEGEGERLTEAKEPRTLWGGREYAQRGA